MLQKRSVLHDAAGERRRQAGGVSRKEAVHGVLKSSRSESAVTCGQSGEPVAARKFRVCRASPAGDVAQSHPLRLRRRRRQLPGIERLCRDDITFIALCGDGVPRYTTIAAFVFSLFDYVAWLLARIVYPWRGVIALRETNSSAICTALSAAPLRILSATTQRLRPFGTLGSRRTRET